MADDEYFDNDNSDRDSLYQPDDVEPDSNDSGETEIYDVAVTDSDSESEAVTVQLQLQCLHKQQLHHAADVWEPVPND